MESKQKSGVLFCIQSCEILKKKNKSKQLLELLANSRLEPDHFFYAPGIFLAFLGRGPGALWFGNLSVFNNKLGKIVQ